MNKKKQQCNGYLGTLMSNTSLTTCINQNRYVLKISYSDAFRRYLK